MTVAIAADKLLELTACESRPIVGDILWYAMSGKDGSQFLDRAL